MAEPYAMLFYGWKIEHEALPEWASDSSDDGESDVDCYDLREVAFTRRLAAGDGPEVLVRLWKDRKSSKAAARVWEDARTEALEKETCTIDRHNTDHTMRSGALVYVDRSLIRSGSYSAVDVPELRIEPGWDAELEAFARRLGLDPQPPGWRMVGCCWS